MLKLILNGLRVSLMAVAITFVNPVMAADEAEHKEEQKPARSGAELSKACASCHGDTGISIDPAFPNLAGQYASYLEHTMKAYRSGDRPNAVMASFATNLTDAEIKNLAAFYAAQDGLATLADER